MSITCQWFALCENPTTEATEHPALGPVPICKRCADRFGIKPEYDIEVAA